ncbi:galactosylgalactosylxylosylprotein 3-beta-glucuronosyltransferase S-like isoform X2 [Oratosquilla oratoria]|uniref:galactosylgalactosylxylosylprotein 3-beta-glucuronosyltransferase S-like isoform X2 n=1 Tax=Oratosquilla oratoria TaxID=337810 RepID=UPI003F7764EA
MFEDASTTGQNSKKGKVGDHSRLDVLLWDKIQVMSHRQRIIMAIIIGGSLIYFTITQVLLVVAKAPSEPTQPEFRKICTFSLERETIYGPAEEESLPIIYVVTPTYKRPEMVAELTRLGQSLLLVPRIHWIIAEDNRECSPVISNLLTRFGLPYTHLVSPMPEIYRKERYIPRGVSNRRAALQWIKENGVNHAVVYFLDDDNAIDIRLFEEMRTTKKVSMWPVGLIGDYSVSSPVVDKMDNVVGFYDGWPADRKFQVDMAGFAVNVGYMKKQPKVTMPYIAGHEEDGFLKSLNIRYEDVEVLASGCTEVMVWHTRTTKNPTRSLRLDKHQHDNIKRLTDNMRQMGMIK